MTTMHPPPRVTALRAVGTTFHCTAIIVTSFRLYLRKKTRRLWWDDAWAAISLVCNIAYFITMWICSSTHLPAQTRTVSYWIMTVMFTNCLWAARMSIIVSIVRFIPPILRMRLVTIACAFGFFFTWMALLVQKAIHCSSYSSWHHRRYIQCHIGTTIGITELCTDFVADVISVVIPLRLLWRAKLPKDQRTLILALCSASILTTLASIPHACFVLGMSGVFESLTAHMEASISLIVCNLLVLVTYTYRVVRGDRDIEALSTEDVPSIDLGGWGDTVLHYAIPPSQSSTANSAAVPKAVLVSDSDPG